MIDLVTPVKINTRRFIDNERTILLDDNDEHHDMENKAEECLKRSESPKLNSSQPRNIIPAGYESDVSGDSDGFELG